MTKEQILKAMHEQNPVMVSGHDGCLCMDWL